MSVNEEELIMASNGNNTSDDDDVSSFGETNTSKNADAGQIQTAAMAMAVSLQNKPRVQSYGKDNANVENDESICNGGDDMSTGQDFDSIATLDQSVSISSNVFNLDQFEINHDDNDKDDDDGLTVNDDSDGNSNHADPPDSLVQQPELHEDSKMEIGSDDEEEAFVQDSTQPELDIDSNDDVADRIGADLLEMQPELHQDSKMETGSDDEEEAFVQDSTQPELDIDFNNDIAAGADADLLEMQAELRQGSKPEPGSDDEEEAFVQDSTQPELDIDSNNVIGNVAAKDDAGPPANTINTVTDQDILDTVDTIFAEADLQTMTTKDIVQSVQDLFQIKLKKIKKKMIKDRLTELVNQQVSDSEETDAEVGADASANEEDGVEDEHETQQQSDYSDNEDEESISPSSSSARKKGLNKSKSRPKRTPKKRIPNHLKIHHESLRKRQMMEQKVLQEEMHDEQQSKISTIDRKRAEDIAKKFQTDSIEMKSVREKERIGLIHVLEQRRFKLMMLESGADNDNDSDSDSEGEDDELEILGKDSIPDRGADCTRDDSAAAVMGVEPPAPVSSAKTLGETSAISRKSSPKSIISYFASNSNSNVSQKRSRKKVFQNPRATLRNALKAKQFENGNKWLARELGYDKVEDHIRECTNLEMKKKMQIIAKEKERLSKSTASSPDIKDEPATSTAESEIKGDNGGNEDEEVIERTRVKLDEDSEPEEEEEDEEMALAREIENSVEKSEFSTTQNDENTNDCDSMMHDDTQDNISTCSRNDIDVDVKESPTSGTSGIDAPRETLKNLQDEAEEVNEIGTGETMVEDHTQATTDHTQATTTLEVLGQDEPDVPMGTSDMADSEEITPVNEDQEENEVEAEFDESSSAKEESQNKPRNAAWKAMLKKEAEQLKKQKARKGNFVDAEAEEEEEEEGVAGLEDFGFTLENRQKADNDEDDGADDADEEDFENIVDDISDNEGDEEAGDIARKDLNLKEEKRRHKDIMRRMRDGYDGKRGGIAGGVGTARGNLRFDELVAADNRESAKKLGLANEDEFDSDDEGPEKQDNTEIEDEAALVDKMLKDRYLNKTDIPAEEFSDSENEEEDGNEEDANRAVEDEEDMEQQILAKRFARRARMNRLLAIYSNDKELSQGGLLDKDETLKKELRSIRTVSNKARRQTSFASSGSRGEHSSLSGFPAPSQSESNLGRSEKSFLSSTSSLSFAINRSRNALKRKSSFLGNNSQKAKAMKSGGISLGSVFFAGDAPSSTLSRSASLPQKRSSSLAPPQKKHAASNTRGSLWSRVASNGFK